MYEKLLNEAYEGGLIVKEKTLNGSDGRIKGKRIAIRKDIETRASKCCVLAEELGHFATSVGDVLNQDSLDVQKQEYKARCWAYEKMLPLQAIDSAFGYGCKEVWEIAEYLNIDEEFLRDALAYYGILDIA